MMMDAEVRRRITLALTLTVAAALVGVGRMPATQAQTIPNIQPIVGTWEGTVKSRLGLTHPVRLTIREDGTWALVALDDSILHYSGTVRVVDGEYRFSVFEDGRTGAYTLGERDGQRMLQIQTVKPLGWPPPPRDPRRRVGFGALSGGGGWCCSSSWGSWWVACCCCGGSQDDTTARPSTRALLARRPLQVRPGGPAPRHGIHPRAPAAVLGLKASGHDRRRLPVRGAAYGPRPSRKPSLGRPPGHQDASCGGVVIALEIFASRIAEIDFRAELSKSTQLAGEAPEAQGRHQTQIPEQAREQPCRVHGR
jgi:hypothetical protein